jgi:phosphate transport system substrate-binding protein
MSRATILRIAAFIVVGGALGVLIYFAPGYFSEKNESSQKVKLHTGGTSVVHFILENRWKTAYGKHTEAKQHKKVDVVYESTGSTVGVKDVIEKKTAIGFVHAAMTPDQKKDAQGKGGEVVHIPIVLCAVVPVYNVKELKGKPPLKFSSKVLARIFLGEITSWNDPALQNLNEGVALPDTPITVVHRQDSSGTTFIFTDYMAGASDGWKKETKEAWQQKIGPAKNEIHWPVGVGKARNEGVALYVYETEGAISYVDLVHAAGRELDYGAVQNKDQTAYIHVEAENMTAAAKQLGADIPEDLTFKLTNRPGKDTYPICGAIWAICYQNQSASSQPVVVDFLNWVLHDGQDFAGRTSYAPLPAELIAKADEKLKSVKSEAK